jgi:hypothetical protein
LQTAHSHICPANVVDLAWKRRLNRLANQAGRCGPAITELLSHEFRGGATEIRVASVSLMKSSTLSSQAPERGHVMAGVEQVVARTDRYAVVGRRNGDI